MLLTVWRHGEAGLARCDAERELTARGRAEVVSAAEAFSLWITQFGHPHVSHLRYSPLTRTSQTAAILNRLWHPACCVADELLVPGASPTDSVWQTTDAAAHVVLVSHEPFVSRAIALWSDDDALPSLLPSGFATLDVLSLERRGATVLRHQSSPKGGSHE